MLEAKEATSAGDEGGAAIERDGAAQCIAPSDLAAVDSEHRAGRKG
jgi:hypothetical protein